MKKQKKQYFRTLVKEMQEIIVVFGFIEGFIGFFT